MKRALALALVFASWAGISQAAIVSILDNGTCTFNGGACAEAAKIELPSTGNVLDDDVTNSAMQGFDEAQGVMLGALGVETDQGFVGANQRVDSHMIFLNSVGLNQLWHQNVVWKFSGQILGVMSDNGGNLEGASNALLGNPGITYPGAFNNRGFEAGNMTNYGEGYSILGNELTVTMFVTEPGDWIRVVTATVPVPAAMPLLLAGLGGLGFMARRKQRKT